MGTDARLTPEAAARFVLGLQPGCTAKDVNRAYKRLALIWHPDKNPGDDAEKAKGKFQAIARARECLLSSRLLGASPTVSRPAASRGGGSMGGPWSRRAAAGRPSPKKRREGGDAAAECSPETAHPSPMFAAWMCGACEMHNIGSSPGACSGPCFRATSSTKCFCGHSFEAHGEPTQGGTRGGKLRCSEIGCLCAQFSYVPPGATCTCGHSSSEHDAALHHSCEAKGCSCMTFHSPGACHCGHNWVCHRTATSQHSFATAGKKRGGAAGAAEADSGAAEADDGSSSDSSEPPLRPPRRRPASANAAGRRPSADSFNDPGVVPPNRPPPFPPAAAPGRPTGSSTSADGRTSLDSDSSEPPLRPPRRRPASANAAGRGHPLNGPGGVPPNRPPPFPPAAAPGRPTGSSTNADGRPPLQRPSSAPLRRPSSAQARTGGVAPQPSAPVPVPAVATAAAATAFFDSVPDRSGVAGVFAGAAAAAAATNPLNPAAVRAKSRPRSAPSTRSPPAAAAPSTAASSSSGATAATAKAHPSRRRPASANATKVRAPPEIFIRQPQRPPVAKGPSSISGRASAGGSRENTREPKRPEQTPSAASTGPTHPADLSKAADVAKPGIAKPDVPAQASRADSHANQAPPAAASDTPVVPGAADAGASACPPAQVNHGLRPVARPAGPKRPSTAKPRHASVGPRSFGARSRSRKLAATLDSSMAPPAAGPEDTAPTTAGAFPAPVPPKLTVRRPTVEGSQAFAPVGGDDDAPSAPATATVEGSQPRTAVNGRRVASKNRRPASASSGLRGTSASRVAAAATAGAAAARKDAGPWWERMHTCGKVRPCSLPVGRRWGRSPLSRAPAPQPSSAHPGESAPTWRDAAATLIGEPVLSSSPMPAPTVHRNSGGPQPQRRDSLGQDSFIFNDDDAAGPSYFGVDSDEEGAFLSARAASPPADPGAEPPLRSRRPLSAPCGGRGGSNSSASTNKEWWRATSSGQAPDWWARDTLRRLHLERLHGSNGPDLGSREGQCEAIPSTAALAAALALKRGSV